MDETVLDVHVYYVILIRSTWKRTYYVVHVYFHINHVTEDTEFRVLPRTPSPYLMSAPQGETSCYCIWVIGYKRAGLDGYEKAFGVTLENVCSKGRMLRQIDARLEYFCKNDEGFRLHLLMAFIIQNHLQGPSGLRHYISPKCIQNCL